MLRGTFHRWERRLAEVDTNRVVRPFDWGLEWIGLPPSASPLADIKAWSRRTMADTDAFYASPAATEYERRGNELRFASAFTSPDRVNNTVLGRIFEPPPRPGGRARRAVIVLPQWNSDANGHVGLCQLFARFGLTAVRLTMPYHDERKPADLIRAEHIVSANIGQTIAANRQAVLDAKGIVGWLASEGYERIGIVGTSLGSCLAMLTMSHDVRIRAGAFNHVSPFFADVVWKGLSTRHVRAGLDGHISLDDLRECWMAISPWPYIDRIRGRAALLVYARYDLTFPVDLSRDFIREFARLEVPHETTLLPCGHYTTGKAPFKYLDGYALTKFLLRRL